VGLLFWEGRASGAVFRQKLRLDSFLPRLPVIVKGAKGGKANSMVWPDDFTDRVICGDALEVMRQMPDGCVDAVITDPPYGVEAAKWDGRVPYEVLPELLRVSRGLVLWFGAAARLQTDLEHFLVKPQRIIIWYVTFSLAHTAAHGMFYRYHPIYLWNLPKKQEGLNQDVVAIPQDGHNGWYHPGTKPIKLMLKLTAMSPENSLVFDPFCGSGTTLVAAKQLGRHWIGVDISPEYCQIAEQRLAGILL